MCPLDNVSDNVSDITGLAHSHFTLRANLVSVSLKSEGEAVYVRSCDHAGEKAIRFTALPYDLTDHSLMLVFTNSDTKPAPLANKESASAKL